MPWAKVLALLLYIGLDGLEGAINMVNMIRRMICFKLMIACFILMMFPQVVVGNDQKRDLGNSDNAFSRDLMEEFRVSIKERPYLGRVYPMIFRKGENEISVPELDHDYSPWEGRKISEIRVVNQNVFDLSYQEDIPPLFRSAMRFGNWLQPRTRLKSIRRNLFVAEGDTLDPDYLIANLQYLYNLGLYSEIALIPYELQDDEVGVHVALREKFFLQLSGKFLNYNEFRVKLMDRNFLGYGHSLLINLFVDPGSREFLGWDSSYTHPNILGTFFQGNFRYQDREANDALEIGFNRDYLYPLMVDYGGLNFSQSNIQQDEEKLIMAKSDFFAWYARAFNLLEFPRYLYGAVSLNVQDHQTTATDAWQDSYLGIAAVGYAASEYRYEPGLSSIFDSDYIPQGSFLMLLCGYEKGERYDRQFMGLQAAGAKHHIEGHLVYGQMAMETYLAEGKTEQYTMVLEPLYISPKRTIGRFAGRSLIFGKAVFSRSGKDISPATLSESMFYRDGYDLAGDKLFCLGLEEDISMPYQFFGFQISTFAFMDVAVVHNEERNESLFTQGIGIRFRNPSLIWDFVELRLSLETSNSNEPDLGISLSVNPTRVLQDFRGRRPQPYHRRTTWQ